MRLTGYTFVRGVQYGPGDNVPDDIAAQITNPKLVGEATVDAPDGSPGDHGPEGVLPKPHGNASREKWAAYAAQELGEPIDDDLSVAEIKALLG